MTIYVGLEIEVEARAKINRYCPIQYLARETEHITHLGNDEISDYHKNRAYSMLGKWRLESDVSLSDGGEFISPPLKIDIALETLETFLKYIDKCGCTTTQRTGLHINMSSNNMCLDDINIDNIIPQINYKLLFNLWKPRFENNIYSRSLKHLIHNNKQSILYAYYSNIYSKKTEKLKAISRILLNKRSGFINLRKNTDGKAYFEIRIVGGENYHKKFESIKQTIKHFENILLNSQKDSIKFYKSFASYVNRVLDCDKKNKLFIPNLSKISFPYAVIKNDIPLIKNVHNYDIQELYTEMRQIHIKKYYLSTKLSLLNVIYTYFKRYMVYIYGNPEVITSKYREKERNYIIYHYCKYIYNNSGKAECIDTLRYKKYNKLHTSNKIPFNIIFDFSIPEDEPKQETLWLINCVKELDIVTKKQFVSKLPLGMLNFLLTYKRPGMINVTKRARKELIKEMTSQNKKLKEETIMR